MKIIGLGVILGTMFLVTSCEQNGVDNKQTTVEEKSKPTMEERGAQAKPSTRRRGNGRCGCSCGCPTCC